MEVHSVENRVEVLGVPGSNLNNNLIGFVLAGLEKVYAKTDSALFYSPSDVIDGLFRRKLQLWLLIKDTHPKGFVITQIHEWPQKKRLDILFAQADGLSADDMETVLLSMEQFAREHKCGQISGSGRLGWLKVLNRKWAKEITYHYDVRETNVIH